MFIYRDYKWSDLPKLMHRTVKTVCIVMILIGFAASFGYIMTLMQIPLKITAAMTALSDNRYVILALINVMLLVLGTLMDMAPLILILTPILLPVVRRIGVDPVHFGMIMMVNLGIGLITPPVGAVLFVGSAVAKLRIEQVVRGDVALLRHPVRGAAAGHLPAGHFAVAAARVRGLTSDEQDNRRDDRGRGATRRRVDQHGVQRPQRTRSAHAVGHAVARSASHLRTRAFGPINRHAV